jgi:hypothetical protein
MKLLAKPGEFDVVAGSFPRTCDFQKMTLTVVQ